MAPGPHFGPPCPNMSFQSDQRNIFYVHASFCFLWFCWFNVKFSNSQKTSFDWLIFLQTENISQLRHKQQRFLLLLLITGHENEFICSIKAEALKLIIMFSLQPWISKTPLVFFCSLCGRNFHLIKMDFIKWPWWGKSVLIKRNQNYYPWSRWHMLNVFCCITNKPWNILTDRHHINKPYVMDLSSVEVGPDLFWMNFGSQGSFTSHDITPPHAVSSRFMQHVMQEVMCGCWLQVDMISGLEVWSARFL